MRKPATIAIILLILAPATGLTGPLDDWQKFGAIDSVVTVFESGWLAGGGVEVVDSAGTSIRICAGYSDEEPHWGFRLGALHPVEAATEIVPVGSAVETDLIARMQDYLDRKYTFAEQKHMLAAGSLRLLAKSGDHDAYLANMLDGYRRQAAMVRWLEANFTADQQARLSRTPFLELKTDREREAMAYLGNIAMITWPRNENLLQRDYLIDFPLTDCGRAPLVIESISTYYDGGTVAVAMTDSAGCRVTFCVDYGMSSLTAGAIYVGSLSPHSPSAKLASLREEQALLGLIKQAVDKNYPRACQQELLKLDRCPSIPQDDYQAWVLLRILRGRGAW